MFGEIYYFQKLYKNMLGQIFIGNNIYYEEFGCYYCFMIVSCGIEVMWMQLEDEWEIQCGIFVVYYLFLNIQMFWVGDLILFVCIYLDCENFGWLVFWVLIYLMLVVYVEVMVFDEDV